MKNDPINHPSHYNSGNIEVIEAIEDWKLSYHLGNAVKYIARAGKKDPGKLKEDLGKAIWYIQRQIEALKDNPCKPNDMNKLKTKTELTKKVYIAPNGKDKVQLWSDGYLDFLSDINPERKESLESHADIKAANLKKELKREPTTIEVFAEMGWKELK